VTDDPTITPTSGPREHAPDPEPSNGTGSVDYEAQDLSVLPDHREAELEYAGFTFKVSEPQSFDESFTLVMAAEEPVLLCQRALQVIIDRPDPLDEVRAELTPWQTVVLATAALDWCGVTEIFDEVQDRAHLQKRAEGVFADDE
jgi:hypothetical protein